jgi:hypothetical protein
MLLLNSWLPSRRNAPPPAQAGGTAPARRRMPWGALLVLGAVLSAWLYVVLLYEYRTLGPGPYYSDLYPRWLGTYEALWNGADPYSPEVEAKIQQGMFGRPLAPGDAIRDQQAFAYPLYTVFVLAPLTLVPFGTLLPVLGVATLALLAGALWGWFGALAWWPGRPVVAGLVLLGLSQPAAIQNVVLHQPTVLVLAFLVGAGVGLVRGHYALAGCLLALATIKPQVSLAIMLWLSLWALADWRRRGGLLLGLGGMMAALLIGAWLLLPGWPAGWLGHLQRYQGYATERPILAAWLPAPLVLLAQVALGGALALFAWRSRHAPPGSLAFNLGLALPGLYSILLLPVWTAYNQILLFPAALLVLQQRPALLARGRAGRLVYALTTSVLIWPYVASAIWVLLWVAGGLLESFTLREMAARFLDAPWVVSLMVPVILVLPLSLLAWPILRRGLAPPAGGAGPAPVPAGEEK